MRMSVGNAQAAVANYSYCNELTIENCNAQK